MYPVQPAADGADDLAIGGAKTLLRKAILLRRDLRLVAERQADDVRRFGLVRQRLADQSPTTVAAYLSGGSEPGTLQLVAWLASQGVEVLLPVLTASPSGPWGKPAWASFAGSDALRVGFRSILEPTTAEEPASALARADLVILPALAANLGGDRLGRGGGWYDRALSHASAAAGLWALLNDDEVLDTIPTHSWDRPVTMIATSSELIACQPVG